jgi:hypothetical protein
MILKNIIPSNVLSALITYVRNYVDTVISPVYCVFSDFSSETVTIISSSPEVLGCTLSSGSVNGINSGQFEAITNGVKYTGAATISVIINVVLCGIDLSGNDTPAHFYIYIDGQQIDSSKVTQIINADGSTVSILCGVQLALNNEVKVYTSALQGGDTFSFELTSINISISQV